MIIFEGPDGGGKSTLAKYISNKLGIEIAPRVVSKEATAMTNLVEWVEDNLNKGFQEVIFDRHRLVSELIYGPTLRAELEPGFDDLEWLGESLYKFYDLNPIIIYCIPPMGTVISNVLQDDDNSIFHDNPTWIPKIWSGYTTRYCLDTLISDRVFHYDYLNEQNSGLDWKAFLASQIGNILQEESTKKS